MTRRALLGAILAFALAAACDLPKQGTPREDAEHEVIVFAAASLQDAFTAMAAKFEALHPGVKVKLAFAGSQQLRTQIEHGASFDVLASADSLNALVLVRANHLGQLATFAENEPVIVVTPAAAEVVRGLEDLPRADRLVVGSPEVPIGRYTVEILERASSDLGRDFRARVETKIASRELSVRQVLSKVVLGEAQAGVVYRSDAVGIKGRVTLVEIPERHNVVARYPLAVAARAPHPSLARAWVDFVRSAPGRDVLVNAGFRVPAEAK